MIGQSSVVSRTFASHGGACTFQDLNLDAMREAESMEESPSGPPAGDAPERHGAEADTAETHLSEPEAPDATLGGYLKVHDRPPAFEGSDGQPYTVSIEVESVGNLLAPYVVYLVFPRWAETGLGIVGHVESSVLWEGKGHDEVRSRAEALPLAEVKRLLDEAILRTTP